MNLLDVLTAAQVLDLPSVADVRAGRFVPRGKIRLIAWRKGEWACTEVVQADVVEWSRLLAEDRVLTVVEEGC